MQISTDLFYRELSDITEQLIVAAKSFKSLAPAQLNHRERPESWSILECLEHLNLYGDFYLPAIEAAILAHPQLKPDVLFKSGFIGNYFANLMKANGGRMKKMKSPADKNPSNSALSVATIDRFIKQQELLKSLMQQSRTTNLAKVKVPVSLTKLIRLRLGDTFRFVVYHNERHVGQAKRQIQLSEIQPLHRTSGPALVFTHPKS